MMALKPIQIPSAHIKPLVALTYQQLGPFTLLHARWNWTTEFFKSPSFAIIYSGLIEKTLNIL